MSIIDRRRLLAGGGALALLAGCANGVRSKGRDQIDQQVDAAMRLMFAEVPETRELAAKAAGVLVMPRITEAGFGIGGSYGRGALRVNGVTVDYYSAASASFGLQLGAKQYAHALFFMTPEALAEFRAGPGWQAGAGIEYLVNNDGREFSGDTTRALSPVIGVVFGQAGLIVGATVEGTKYTRIIP